MECLILAGGLGTRMRAVDAELPKAMLPVAGKPFAYWQLAWLATQKVDVVYSIGHRGDLIRSYVGDGSRWGIAVRYVEEKDGLLGTGGAVRFAAEQELLGERFFVLYGDAYLRLELHTVERRFRGETDGALMTVLRNNDQWDRSNVVFRDGRVLQYVKGCEDRPSDMRYIDYGLTEIRRDVVERCIPTAVPYDLGTVFSLLSREGRLGGYEVSERFYEVGSPEGLLDLERFLTGNLSG
jgi:NDP-sugar pyrophosphorylase family protein